MPIPVEQRVTAIVFSLLLLLVTVQLIRKHKLREEYALLWLTASVAIFILSVFGGLVNVLAASFDVSYAPTLILVLGLLFALVVLLSQSVVISSQADCIRDLTQDLALVEWRLRRLENDEETADNHHRVATQPALPHLSSHRKVLVVGLDGATFDLIKPWAGEGYLPTLSRLMREGASGELRSTVPPMTAPAWTSFATGTNPGKHRLYDWIARDPGTYRFSPITARDCTAPMLYTLLSQAGRRVCTLNVPMTYPPRPVNGCMVSGLPAPSIDRTITYPDTLLQEILDTVGDYILYPDPGQAYSDSGVDAFLERLYRCTDLRARTFEHLRSRDEWDFAMVVFNGTDTISHALWKYMDPEHPLHDPARYENYGHAIRDYYRYVDARLGDIVDTLDDDTTLIVMSDHGFGPFHKFIHVNTWLMEEGLLHVQPALPAQIKRRLFRRGLSPMNVYNLLMRLGLGALKREVVRGQGQGLLKKLFLSFEDVDWDRTVAYSLGNVGQIYVNLAGREPRGCVSPGPVYERVRDDIIARLSALRDPSTGERVVESVHRREELYSGAYLEHAPDIVFIPRRLEYFGFGEYEFGSHTVIEPMQRGISGTHRMNGVVLARGPTIRPGAELAGARIIDLAPTILHLMGETVPDHMDGRVLDELFEAGLSPKEVSRRQSWHLPPEQHGEEEVLSEEEKQIVADRLRTLGYVS